MYAFKPKWASTNTSSTVHVCHLSCKGGYSYRQTRGSILASPFAPNIMHQPLPSVLWRRMGNSFFLVSIPLCALFHLLVNLPEGHSSGAFDFVGVAMIFHGIRVGKRRL